VTELDPFYAIAFDYVPYRQLDATLSRDLGEHLTVAVGAEVRRLRDRSDERAFNRKFERYHADLTLLDLGARGLSLTFSGSLWESSGEAFRTAGFDLLNAGGGCPSTHCACYLPSPPFSPVAFSAALPAASTA
ncbi:MAG: hypothetical protein ABIP94_14195, partial [Planctomycetota bacterium]